MTTPINPDVDTIRRLVTEVIERVRAEGAPSCPAPSAAASSSQQASNAGVAVADKVVTLAVLQRLPTGTSRAGVPAGAVITPSAREYARDAGIELVRAIETPSRAAPRRMFIVAHADCGGEAVGCCAAVVRGVPDAQQLPATGLVDVINAIATHASRDGARAVLICGRPAAAVTLANRSPSLRAVTAHDAARLGAAAAECSANLLVVGPKTFSNVSLERVSADFARRDLGVPPVELVARTPSASSSCSCKGHAH